MTETERLALASVLKTRRVSRGLSIRELSRQSGVDKATITLLEQGRKQHPRVATIQELAGVLELPLADIYAATNWLPAAQLPTIGVYMRAKYSDLTVRDLAHIEQLVTKLSGQNSGPRPGEDE